MDSRISIDPKICHGQACVRGTRIPVHQIISMLANGDTIESLLQAYPSLERADILACLEHAAWGQSFANSQDKLSTLADEALAEFKQGKTQPLDEEA
jgi:uncharacterized protein (DUF433 family)